MEENNR
jgi:hypothetical protein